MESGEARQTRPDPDELLHHANAEAAREHRGKLKIFFGASAGVGKTYAMLGNARQLKEQGVDVVVGLVETHGRKETMALLQGLEILPRKGMAHRDRTLEEFDVDAALQRRPAVLLVDELAHTNVPGSRHPKRWQDVEELLKEGIDVHSTLNVQHLESLNDVVGSITGIPVWEKVPDKVFDAADEIVLVDLPADDLLRRLREGKVYMPAQAERAVQNFFRKGNLIALREIALRRTADRIDNDVRSYRREIAAGKVWHTRERVLACVGPSPGSEQVLRAASRFAQALNADWHTVYVETPSLQQLPDAQRASILQRLKLAQDMGAMTASIAGEEVAQALVVYARKHNVTKLVLGRTTHRSWFHAIRPDLPQRVATLAPDVDVVLVGREDYSPKEQPKVAPAPPPDLQSVARRYGAAVAACIGITLASYFLVPQLERTNIAMLFLAAVLPIAFFFGRRPAILSAVINVLAFDVFFVPPRFSLAVSDAQYLITFGVMLGVGLLTANLTAGLRHQARIAKQREERVRDLYQLARELSGALTEEQITEIVGRAIEGVFNAKCAVLLPTLDNRLQVPKNAIAEIDPAIAQWSYDRATPAGACTDTLPASPVHYLPLSAPMRVRGVLALVPPDGSLLLTPEWRQQLETLAALAAIALERVHFVTVAQDTLVKIESQRLRESLLSALSHDLRTPVTAIVGIAESLAMDDKPGLERRQELIASLHRQAQGMARLVTNTLDMARLESSHKPLRPDWQSLEEIVGAARRSIEDLLRGRDIRVEIPEDYPLLFADAVLLERVFVNLLENAVKYVPPDKAIGISARVEEGQAMVEVWDEGKGLPGEEPDKLFRKFVRGSSEAAIAGVGLGLAICRAIVQAHGGSITACNREQGGASFLIKLPLKEPPEMEPEAAPETAVHG